MCRDRDGFLTRQTDRETDRPVSLCDPFPVSGGEWEQTGDITSCWGQSHRNGPGACTSAVIVITTLTTAKNTHLRTQTHRTVYRHAHNNTIVSSEISVSWVCWHNPETLYISVCLWDCFPVSLPSCCLSISVWVHIENVKYLSSSFFVNSPRIISAIMSWAA